MRVPTEGQNYSIAVSIGSLNTTWSVTAYLSDPCNAPTSPSIGTQCSDGTFYIGEMNGFRYMTTPGNCTDSANPTCNNSTDTLYKTFNNGSTSYVTTGANSLTDGAANTSLLASLSGTDAPYMGAVYCNNLVFGAREDWFLPAKDELLLLRDNTASIWNSIGIQGVGNWYYLSSTETSNSQVWILRFGDRYNYGEIKNFPSYRVRCLRKTAF